MDNKQGLIHAHQRTKNRRHGWSGLRHLRQAPRSGGKTGVNVFRLNFRTARMKTRRNHSARPQDQLHGTLLHRTLLGDLQGPKSNW